MPALWKESVNGNPDALRFRDASGAPRVGWMTNAGNGATGRTAQFDSAPAASTFSNYLSGRSQLKIGGMPVTGSSIAHGSRNPADMYDMAKMRGAKNPFQGSSRRVVSPSSGGGSTGGSTRGGGYGGGRRSYGGGGGSERQKIHGITQEQIAGDQAAQAKQEAQDAARGDAEWNAFFRDTPANQAGVAAEQQAGNQSATLEGQQDANWRKLAGMDDDPQAQTAYAKELAWRRRFQQP